MTGISFDCQAKGLGADAHAHAAVDAFLWIVKADMQISGPISGIGDFKAVAWADIDAESAGFTSGGIDYHKYQKKNRFGGYPLEELHKIDDITDVQAGIVRTALLVILSTFGGLLQ